MQQKQIVMKSILNRLIRLDYLIHLKATGKPADCACKIGISERSLYDYLKILKEMGAPIKFSRNRGTYYYMENGRFRVSFIPEGMEEHLEESKALAN
jgi:predicted DNA-binding transcriptional regulator YafY